MGLGSFLRRLYEKARLVALEKPVPLATQREMELIGDLRREFESFRADPSQVGTEWSRNADRLREHVVGGDVRSFLRWDVVRDSMFVGNEPYLEDELDYLKRLPEWEARWSRALAESPVGHPPRSVLLPGSSGNLIHHAYHIARFEDATGMRADQFDLVLEFGGGYGLACRLLHSLGFTGQYVIYDLPQLSAIQRYYLRAHCLPVRSASRGRESSGTVACVSSLAELDLTLHDSVAELGGSSLFLATWSLSEAPPALRDSVVSRISGFGAVLIAYQSTFSGVDNVQYFDNLKHRLHGIKWCECGIEHLEGNWYLVGVSGRNGET